MKFWTIALAFTTCVLGSTPKPPTLTHLYTANVTLGTTVDFGPGPRGHRSLGAAAGGTFSGPKLHGTILAVGEDKGVFDANSGTNGTYSIDLTLVFQTHDGANILITATGRAPFEQLLLETGSQEYYWVNSVTAVGKVESAGPSALTVHVWQLG
ncbi:hypothetical protein GQ53DRAFT_205983 [Thozetella sp. PMI_491]|nr:hypothetical protein GQ53DRAFT_205983 [Thozetella sp. PMI_491]